MGGQSAGRLRVDNTRSHRTGVFLAAFVLMVSTVAGVAHAPFAHASPIAPLFTSADHTSVAAKSPLTFLITTTDTPPAVVRAKHLPKWLALGDNGDGTATLTGTPPRVGITTLQLVASNGAGPRATQTFTITAFSAPQFLSAAHDLEGRGTAFEVDVATSGFPTATLSSADLPAWLTLTDLGTGHATLAGTPPATGIFTFTLTATNIGASVDQPFTLRVKKHISGRPATVGGTYRLTVDWLGAGHGILRAVLNADGTGKLKHFGNAITWTLTGTAFHMVIAGGDPATFDGVTTARGFNSKKHPGTMTNMAGDRGTWYARLV